MDVKSIDTICQEEEEEEENHDYCRRLQKLFVSQSILKSESRKTTCTSKNEPADDKLLFSLSIYLKKKKKVENGLWKTGT